VIRADYVYKNDFPSVIQISSRSDLHFSSILKLEIGSHYSSSSSSNSISSSSSSRIEKRMVRRAGKYIANRDYGRGT
jgi:hypothetical protein